jgi:hypothetical protein
MKSSSLAFFQTRERSKINPPMMPATNSPTDIGIQFSRLANPDTTMRSKIKILFTINGYVENLKEIFL